MSLAGKILGITVNKFNQLVDGVLPRFFYKNRALAAFYYMILHNGFKREFTSVLAGKAKHLEDSRTENGNYFLLVRNIHRLEKGLLMRPRKAVFAADYISETVDSFQKIVTGGIHNSNYQLKWAKDVLEEYFTAVQPGNPVIDEQRIRFNDVKNLYEDASGTDKFVPYKRAVSESPVLFDEYYKLTQRRRSVRWFRPDPVPRELIDKAILAANQSPSACNRQPFEFRVFDKKELVEKVMKIPMGTKGYAGNIPVAIVVVGNLDAYFSERDRHVIYIDASLASMSLMLALETLGLSSCPINWPDIESRERQMEELLQLEKYQRPIMCIGLGYADEEGMVAFSEKRPLELIRNYNKCRQDL